MRELPPFCFGFGNYGADIPVDVFVNNEKLVDWLACTNVVGYSKCPAYRHRKGYVAVMIEEGCGQYWAHVPWAAWELYLGTKKRKASYEDYEISD
jgi:hypothetical protein